MVKNIKMNKQAMTTESGRSMVEMLGTLAIIGVLSIGGIAGYEIANKKLKVNEIMNEVNTRAIHVSSQLIAGNEGSLESFEDLADSGISYSLGTRYSFSNPPGPSEEAFIIIAESISKPICEEIFRFVEDSESIIELKKDYRTVLKSPDDCEDGILGFVYYNDLGNTNTPSHFTSESDCREKGYFWCDAGNGTECVGSAEQCCEDKSCESGTKCVYGECQECQEKRLDDGKTYCLQPGDTYACNSYSGSSYRKTCIVCHEGVAQCPYVGISNSDTTGKTNCVCKDEMTACQGISNCTRCEEGQTLECSEYQTDYCVCAYEEDNVACAEYGSGCIACPQDEEPHCAMYGYGTSGCVCDANSNWKCNDSYCVSCPIGEIPTCAGTNGSCYCMPEDANFYCNEDSCAVCEKTETPVCAGEWGYCYCVPAGGTYKCSTYDGYECKVCDVGQTVKCPESEYEYGTQCVCISSDETAACGYSSCKVCQGNEKAYCDDYGCYCEACPVGEKPLCSSSGSCTCVKEGDSQACSSSTCISCPTGEAVCSTGGSCVCVQSEQIYQCNSTDCVACNPDETTICSSAGDCYCVPQGGTYKCLNNECAVCTGTDEPICANKNYGSCICKKENEYAKAGTSTVTTCSTNNFVHGYMEGEYCTTWVCVPEGMVGVCDGYSCITCPADKGGSCPSNVYYGCRCNY